LSGVSSIDAAGVGELVHLFTTAAAAGGVVEIAGMSSRIRRVLDVSGVLGLLDVDSAGARSTSK
jgi:anti-anti-sigma regulatory factor